MTVTVDLPERDPLPAPIATDASEITFLPAGNGAVETTVQTKARESVSARDFGAVADGVTDDTAALAAVFDYAVPLGKPIELEGDYLVTAGIQTYSTGYRASGEMHIVCKGRVTITVSAGATAFRELLYFHTLAENSGSIIGGSLSINCNSKAASGITFRHDAASQGGTVNITCPVEVLNCVNSDASATYENQGISVYGDYKTVVINNPRVDGVSRVSTASGAACKGIGVAAFSGTITINQPYVANVLAPSGSADADGIATFGKDGASAYAARVGIVTVNEPVFVDCQGRSFKSQCSDTTVYRPRVHRQSVVSITNGTDFDFQFGGQSLLVEPYYEYRLNSGVSPLGSSFQPVVFQQVLSDRQNVARSVGGCLRTEATVPRYCGVIHQSTALESYTEVSGLVVQAIGSFATKAMDRAVIEFDASTVEAKSTKTVLVVRGCRGPLGGYLIGHTGYVSGALTAKLTFEVTDNYNTITSSILRPFSSLSGASILAVEKFVLRNNYGYQSLMPSGWTFNFNNLAPGNFFTVDLATVSATNAPGWAGSGYAFIECMDQWANASTYQHIRVTVDNAATSSTVFYTQGGTTPTWGTIL